ncbi:MAG TPA: protein jag [Dehalococcoidia bacterium]|nr:protein jag [Dehalococcoidia bacterium]
MESLEARAKTVEEAIQQAISRLGVSREEVEVDVISEGKSGILGLGGDEAVVRVTPITPASDEDLTEYVQNTINELLGFLGVEGSAVPQPPPVVEGEEPTESISLNIEGNDLGILIGRRGQTLTCLQYIVRLIVGHQKRSWLPIIIDVEGYKQRRYQALQVFARQMAEQVNAKKMSFTLEPMPAYERRIIHLALAEHHDVVTESIGQGESRRVVILPKEE